MVFQEPDSNFLIKVMLPAKGWTAKNAKFWMKLVVKLHLKEAINGLITLEIKFKLNIIEAGRFDKPVGENFMWTCLPLMGLIGSMYLSLKLRPKAPILAIIHMGHP